MRGALSCAEQLLCSAAQDPASQTAPTIRRIIIFLPLLELKRSTGLDEFPIFGLASLVAFPGNRHWPREIRTFAGQLPRPFHISDKRYIRLAGQLFGLDFLQPRFWTDSKPRDAPVDNSSFRRRVLPYFRISDNPIGIA